MQAMRMMVLAAAFALAACGGTGRFVQRGMDAYKYGDYPLAMEHFHYVESEGMELNPKGEVRYLVYKGLTLVHLGKKDEGKAFLIKGREAYRAGDARWLAPEIVTEMEATLESLGVK